MLYFDVISLTLYISMPCFNVSQVYLLAISFYDKGTLDTQSSVRHSLFVFTSRISGVLAVCVCEWKQSTGIYSDAWGRGGVEETSCVTPSKLLNPSVPLLPHLQNKGNDLLWLPLKVILSIAAVVR